MGIYTDWFLAEESEAKAIASIASEDGNDFDDWPHLALKGVGKTELMLLRGVLLGRPGEMADGGGDALFVEEDEEDGGGVLVRRVLPEFVRELSALTDAGVQRVAEAWRGCEGMEDWEAHDATATLREIADFIRRAHREGKPVLEFATW